MKLIASSVVSLLLVSGPALAAEEALNAGDPSAGEAISGSCAGCHGAAGVSVNPEWPNLAGQHARYLEKQLHDFKQGTERNNALMAGMVASLGDQDMADLAAYYAVQPAPEGTADPAQVELGEKIYRGGNAETGVPACIACHGPAGVGGPLSGFPALAGQHATYTANQLRMFRSGERANDMNQMMRNAVQRITDAEIEAVSSYVQGLYRVEAE